MRVTYLEANGIPTRCYTAGSGYPLLLIHGIGASTDSWLKVIDPLAEHFQVVAPDLMGHGFTGVGDFTGGPPQPHMVKHLLGVADAAGFDRFSILGSSYGALLTLLCYFERKEKVDKLVLLSSASSTMPDEERLGSYQHAYNVGIATMEDPSLESVRKRMTGMVYRPETVPPELVFMQMNVFGRPEVRQGFEAIMKGKMNLEACRQWDVHNRFGDVDCPLLMLWGLNDPRAKTDQAKALAGEAREAYFVGLEDCAHVPHIEQPEQVVAFTRKFLTGADLSAHRVS